MDIHGVPPVANLLCVYLTFCSFGEAVGYMASLGVSFGVIVLWIYIKKVVKMHT